MVWVEKIAYDWYDNLESDWWCFTLGSWWWLKGKRILYNYPHLHYHIYVVVLHTKLPTATLDCCCFLKSTLEFSPLVVNVIIRHTKVTSASGTSSLLLVRPSSHNVCNILYLDQVLRTWLCFFQTSPIWGLLS